MRRVPKAQSHGTQSPMKVPKARLYGTYPTLHDRAGTSASLLYKDEKLSVDSFFQHADCCMVSPWIVARFPQN